MTYTSLLINWCAIMRYTTGAADSSGRPKETWAPVHALDDIPCRLMSITGVELTVGAEVVIADYKLFLGDVAVTEQDRVIVLLASSIAIGSDGNEYVSIAPHTATALDEPITGANWMTYWGLLVTATGLGKAWLLGTVYLPALTYEILLVKNMQDGITSHHKECLLRTVR